MHIFIYPYTYVPNIFVPDNVQEQHRSNDACASSPLDAIVHAHYLELRCAALVGDLGQRWALCCDEAADGAADPKVL
jgi:hypothetical protein